MEKVRIAIAGLGRLGKIHANHLCGQIPGAEVTAACLKRAALEDLQAMQARLQRGGRR